MTHKTYQVLKQELAVAVKKVAIGGIYSHYKDPASRYEVSGLSVLEASDEIAVKYVSIFEPEVEFVRSLELWLETVDYNGEGLPRFRKVEN